MPCITEKFKASWFQAWLNPGAPVVFLGLGLSPSLGSALPHVGCILRPPLFSRGQSGRGCSWSTCELSHPRATTSPSSRQNSELNSTGSDQTRQCSQGLECSDWPAPGQRSSLGMESGPLTHMDQGASCLPGVKLECGLQEKGDWGPGTQATANAAASAAHPPNPTGNHGEPGARPRHDLAPFPLWEEGKVEVSGSGIQSAAQGALGEGNKQEATGCRDQAPGPRGL